MNKTTYFLLGFISLFFFIYTIIWGIVGLNTKSEEISYSAHNKETKLLESSPQNRTN